MELYLLRHAIAAAPGSMELRSDAERPLTEDGIKKMRKAVHGIKAMALGFDEVISSPYLRARQTADLVMDELEMDSKIKLSEALVPSADFKDFVKLISQYPSEKKLLLIGHEPSLSGFVSALISSGKCASLEFKKGGMCCVEVLEIKPSPVAQLKWLLTPQQLASLH